MNIEVPLSPIQRWFLHEEGVNHNSLIQRLILEPNEMICFEDLVKALNILVKKHPIFNMKFKNHKGFWSQIYSKNSAKQNLDLCEKYVTKDTHTTEDIHIKFKESLNIEEGNLLKCILIESIDSRKQHILLIMHHLVIEGVSWISLANELESLYIGVKKNTLNSEDIPFCGYIEWANWLKKSAESVDIDKEKLLWENIISQSSCKLLYNKDKKDNSVSSFNSIKLKLKPDETRALQNTLHGIETSVVAAILKSILFWKKAEQITVSLSCHDRIFNNCPLDIKREIGWFTSIYPLNFLVKKKENILSSLHSVKEAIESVPKGGLGYGILKYMKEINFCNDELPEIIINNLGERKRSITNQGLFTFEREEQAISHEYKHPYLFDIDYQVFNGILEIIWSYSKNNFSEKIIKKLSDQSIIYLKNIISYSHQ